MAKTRNARQDLVGRLRPLERLRALVRDVDVATNGCLQLARAAMNPAAQLFLGERGEPPFDEIHPRSAGRCEVHMKPRMSKQPAVNHRGLVRARVVDDQVDVELRRHRRIDGRQELAKLSRPVALMKLADDFATLRIQGREESWPRVEGR